VTMPADVEAFTAMLAQLLRDGSLCEDADLGDPELLAGIPQDYLMDSLVVMRRVGLDPKETACLCAIYLGLNQARIQSAEAPDAIPWAGQFDALADAGRRRLAQGRMEPLFLLFETALGEQMAQRRGTMN
jgi:hypothetical protein